MAKENNSSGRIGFLGALQLIFITLKLLGKIEWSWVWVLSPTWIVILILIVLVLIAGSIALISEK